MRNTTIIISLVYLDVGIQPLALTEGGIDDLVAFLASLTSSDYKEQGS